MPKKHHTRESAAEYIGRSVATLDKWRYERIVLPFYSDRRKIWYLEEDLDAYLESNRVEPVAYGAQTTAA